jgi:hypothetical protein
MCSDILLHRAPISYIDRNHQDLHLVVLPPHFPPPEPSTLDIRHHSILRTVHHCVRHTYCSAVHSSPLCLGAMGWRAPRKMYRLECRRLGVCCYQHRSRFGCNPSPSEGAEEPRHEPSPQIWRYAHVPWWWLVSLLPQDDSTCSDTYPA